jgi:AraC family transcriptional regulator
VSEPTRDDAWPGRAWRGRLDLDQSLLTQSLNGPDINVIRHARRSGRGGWSDPSPISDGFIVTPCLRPTRLAEVQFDGKTVATATEVPKGGLLVYSMKATYQVHIPDPFDAVSFRLDQAALEAAAKRLGMRSAPELSEPFSATSDDVMLHLSRCLFPALRKPAELNRLFAGHVVDAAIVHLVSTAGRLRQRMEPATQGPERELRMAQDYLLAHLADDVSAGDLARLCGLSVDQFNRAFKALTGVPPHRWLVRARVQRAQELLEHSNQPISDIAISCGFADQSHLTRVFLNYVGSPPGAWRRHRRR